MYKKVVKSKKKSRRSFLSTAAVIGAAPFFPNEGGGFFEQSLPSLSSNMQELKDKERSIIGGYGPWASGLVEDPPPLSFRNDGWSDMQSWQGKALEKTRELVSVPSLGDKIPEVVVKDKYEYDGLLVEKLQWQLPYGRPTEAILLKPVNATGTLPAVLALHDHGGQKYFGNRKITRTSNDIHPRIEAHQKSDYSGRAWANELARNGYVVLVHDTFTFGSRRVMYRDISKISWGHCDVKDKSDIDPENPDNIDIYNKWAAEHEHIMAKSLFCSGTTWPGVTLYEDQKALDILCDRSDVDEHNVGCCGLSGGGLRTDYLGGLDHRIKCAISVGFISTWRDFLLNKSYTHTWMTYTPLLPKYIDFPEILGLRVPLPTMVLCDIDDGLYTLDEMKRADKILRDVFYKAGASDKYSGKFYPGPHKFDADMQKDAFEWFDKWLSD